MVHPQWPAHWLGLPVSQTEWETGQWLQPFHIPCQHLRPLQALAEQNTDWEESVKRPDSSLKPFWDMAELQVQVLGHETAGLSKVRNISWRHFLSATPMYQKRGSSKRKKIKQGEKQEWDDVGLPPGHAEATASKQWPSWRDGAALSQKLWSNHSWERGGGQIGSCFIDCVC